MRSYQVDRRHVLTKYKILAGSAKTLVKGVAIVQGRVSEIEHAKWRKGFVAHFAAKPVKQKKHLSE